MASHLSEEASWAAAVANRLRLVQNNCVDEPPPVREEFLAEEIEHALKEVAPSKRKASLQALAEMFPAWNSAAPPAASPQAPLAPAQTPEEVFQAFISLVEDSTAQQKLSFIPALKKAGLVPEAPRAAGGPMQSTAELDKLFGWSAGQTLDPERVIKILSDLGQLVVILDQNFSGVLRQIGVRIPPRADLKGLTGKYLAGDSEVSTQQVRQALEQSRTLMAGLLMAMASVGREYARKHTEHFSPEMISEQAPMIRGFKGVDAKCWERYQELYKDYANEQTIEKEIQDAIARCFKEVTGGRFTG